MYSVILIGGLIVVSGLIAFIGDRLGRWLGRRRIMVLGLRPRNTAILTTVISGTIITGLTLIVMSSVSEYARIGLFQVHHLVNEQKRLNDGNLKLTNRLKKLNSQLKEAHHKLDLTKGELGVKIEELDEARELARSLSAQIKAKTKDLAEVKSQLKIALQKYEKANAEVKEKMTEVKEKVKERDEAIAKSELLTKQISSQMQELALLQEDLKVANSSLAVVRGDLTEATQKYQQAKVDLSEITDELENKTEEVENATRVLTNLFQDSKELEEELAERKAEIQRLEKLREKLSIVRAGKIVFRANEEIISKVFSVPVSEAGARLGLREVISEAGKLAEKRGAKAEEGEKSVLVVKAVKLPSGEERTYYEDEIVRSIADEISNSKESVIVCLVALRNFVEGEQVIADFQLFRNKLVFKGNEHIISERIDGSLPQVKIFEQLIKLLRGQVKLIAFERGIMPGAGGEVGEVSYEELFQVVDKIKRKGQKVRVSFVVAEDTWTIGPLRVKFKLG